MQLLKVTLKRTASSPLKSGVWETIRLPKMGKLAVSLKGGYTPED